MTSAPAKRLANCEFRVIHPMPSELRHSEVDAVREDVELIEF